MKNCNGLAALLYLLIFSPLSATAEQPRALDGSEGLTRTGSGLVLHKSGVDHIQSVLGPTLVFRVDLASDARRMCYTAAADNSLIAFEIENQSITRIQVMADKHHYNRWDWCTAMPLSADDLALSNGVALGLKPTDVLKLLGAPLNRKGGRWRYTYRLKAFNGRKPSRHRRDLKDHRVRLEVEFADSRLIRFDLRVGLVDSAPAATTP